MFTVRHNGYTSEVKTTADDSAAHRELIALGFTCDRQDYGPDDSVTASYFHHTTNTHWTAEIVRETGADMSIGPASDPGMFEGEHALTDDQRQTLESADRPATFRGEAVPMRRWTLVFTVGVETFEQEVNAINLTSAWDEAFRTIDVVTGDGDDPESIRLDEHRVSVHVCDECQASVRRNRTMISPDHTETCSLHPSNVI